jgi:hypothetical protein
MHLRVISGYTAENLISVTALIVWREIKTRRHTPPPSLPGRRFPTRPVRLPSQAAVTASPHIFKLILLMRKLFCSIAALTVPNWLTLQGKPGTFPPSAHGHPVTDITGLTWAAVASKPSSFPPSTHSHAISDITGLVEFLAPLVRADPPQDDVFQSATVLGSDRDVVYKIPGNKGPLSVRYVLPAGSNPVPLTASFSGGVLTFNLGLAGTPGSAVPSTTANDLINLSIGGLFPPGSAPVRYLPVGSPGSGIIAASMTAMPLVAVAPTVGMLGQLCIVNGTNSLIQYPFVCVSVSPIKWASASSRVVFNSQTQTWLIVSYTGPAGGSISTSYSPF